MASHTRSTAPRARRELCRNRRATLALLRARNGRWRCDVFGSARRRGTSPPGRPIRDRTSSRDGARGATPQIDPDRMVEQQGGSQSRTSSVASRASLLSGILMSAISPVMVDSGTSEGTWSVILTIGAFTGPKWSGVDVLKCRFFPGQNGWSLWRLCRRDRMAACGGPRASSSRPPHDGSLTNHSTAKDAADAEKNSDNRFRRQRSTSSFLSSRTLSLQSSASGTRCRWMAAKHPPLSIG